jgi:hypothetical protein
MSPLLNVLTGQGPLVVASVMAVLCLRSILLDLIKQRSRNRRLDAILKDSKPQQRPALIRAHSVLEARFEGQSDDERSDGAPASLEIPAPSFPVSRRRRGRGGS